MTHLVKELRNSTGMTQKSFSDMYGIPLSTLRKWEQGETSPAPYVINFLTKLIPEYNGSLKKMQDSNGHVYYYNEIKRTVLDAKGNEIIIQEDLGEIKEQNLILYLEELFDSFYGIQDKFNRDCRFDKEDDIIWTRFISSSL
ncbi:MAG: helix-turn-helix domain-containing protein [bacterium]|nr:helix-turn-helix domain-containing protein [bacterium]